MPSHKFTGTGFNSGEKNGMWKGDKVGLEALHEWVKNRLPRPKLCTLCGIRPAKDLANISQKYKRDLTDWEYICRRCHMIKDGRMEKFFRRKKERFTEVCKNCQKQFILPTYRPQTFCSHECVLVFKRNLKAKGG